MRDERPLAGRPDHGLRRRLLLLLRGHAPRRSSWRASFGATLYVCSAFDVEYHHVVFHNIKDVLSVQASKVFKFEEQEELHNNIIDKGLLKLCQANLKRAEVDGAGVPGRAAEDPDPGRQALPGDPAVGGGGEAVPARRRAPRRPPDRRAPRSARRPRTSLRLAPCNLLLVGHGRHPARGHPLDRGGRPGRPAVGARRRGAHPARAALRAGHRAARGRGVRARAGGRRDDASRTSGWTRRSRSCCRRTCSSSWASAPPRRSRSRRSRPRSSCARTKVEGHDDDPEPAVAEVETKCPITGRVGRRPRAATDPIVWTRGGVEPPARGAAHRAAARPQHGRALRARPRASGASRRGSWTRTSRP